MRDGPNAPVRFLGQIGEAVQGVVADHEERMHVPAPNRGRLRAIPFPGVRLSDVELARVLEWIEVEDLDARAAARRLDVPVLALERNLAEFAPRWRRFLAERAAGF